MTATPFHPLRTALPRPQRFTYPFCYEPHPLCLLAAEEVQRYIAGEPCWQEEIARGKMFGVLVVEQEGRLGYLAAYSGQLDGRNDWPFFVPAVYDMLQPDGPFKKGERRITAINLEVEARLKDPDRQQQEARLRQLRQEAEQAIAAYKRQMDEAKRRRDEARMHSTLTAEEEDRLTRESQFMKAELRRIKKRFAGETAEVETRLKASDEHILQLKRQRRQLSDELQQWLFAQFRMLNAKGEERDLCDIFAHTVGHVPPSGAGECCAPKLLQYAYTHHLHPVCMAEFWWGASPKSEIRHHLHYYPACRGKCKPILEHMLQGLNVDPDPLAAYREHQLETVYDDPILTVVCKPEGMLSVPGRGELSSVLSEMRRRYPKAEGPMIVHRLDMDTSGLLVVAKTTAAYLNLQRQFCDHSIHKRYVALLTRRPDRPADGTISLPLRPDPLDRPRQTIDRQQGKTAVTEYHLGPTAADGTTLVMLYPHTGRTHQLRVHCAHADGLDAPIVGDRLYGQPAERLCLHAEQLTFTHPATGRRITFERPIHFPH